MTAVEGSITVTPAFAEVEQHRRALTAYCGKLSVGYVARATTG